MIRKTARVEKHNTRIAIFFVIFVIAVIFISIVIKTMSLLGESRFDGKNRFTISVLTGKNFKAVSFSPGNDSISVLKIEEENKELKLGQFLKIPIDGFVVGNSLKTDKDITDLMSDVLFNYNNVKTNLTIIDVLRLVLASKTTSENNIETYSISTSLEYQKADKIVEKIFKNEEIEKENQTIEIINTTDIGGLGGRLARLLTNMGGNVIQVSTQNNSQKESVILFDGKKNFTIERISKVLSFRPIASSKKSIADITIIIGEDNRNPLSF